MGDEKYDRNFTQNRECYNVSKLSPDLGLIVKDV